MVVLCRGNWNSSLCLLTSKRAPTSWSGEGAKDWLTYMNCGAKKNNKNIGIIELKDLKKYFYRSAFFFFFEKPTNDLHSHQLFTGVQFEEARDELRQGLHRPPPFHSPLLLFHDGGIAHSLQQQINYENAEITKLILFCPYWLNLKS